MTWKSKVQNLRRPADVYVPIVPGWQASCTGCCSHLPENALAARLDATPGGQCGERFEGNLRHCERACCRWGGGGLASKPSRLPKFVNASDVKVSARDGVFLSRHVGQSGERGHVGVTLSRSRHRRDSAFASRVWRFAARVEPSFLRSLCVKHVRFKKKGSLLEASQRSGRAADNYEHREWLHVGTESQCNAAGMSFIPVVLETSGRPRPISQSATQTLDVDIFMSSGL